MRSSSPTPKKNNQRRLLPTMLVHLAGWLPALWLAASVVIGGREALGANPVERLSHFSGSWALNFLLAALAVSPLRALSGWRWPLTVRRALGLYCFAWASTHLAIYWLFDLSLALSLLADDLLKRPYILLGSLAWVCLLQLALTSTRGWQRRLGRRWKRLHSLIYAAAVLAAVHYLMQPKSFEFTPLLYAGAIALLLAARLPAFKRLLSSRK